MQGHDQQRRLLRIEKDSVGSIDDKAFAVLFAKGVQRFADQVDQRRLVPIVVPQQIVRASKRMQSGNEGIAFGGRVVQSLGRNGLNDRQRILGAMLDFVDEQLLPLLR